MQYSSVTKLTFSQINNPSILSQALFKQFIVYVSYKKNLFRNYGFVIYLKFRKHNCLLNKFFNIVLATIKYSLMKYREHNLILMFDIRI
jgi:hypothetical protein